MKNFKETASVVRSTMINIRLLKIENFKTQIEYTLHILFFFKIKDGSTKTLEIKV